MDTGKSNRFKALRPLFLFVFLASLPLILTQWMGESRKEGVAPEIRGIHDWINSPPLRMAHLRDQVVLVDFWTFSCINCIRTLPYLKAWDERYRDKGLVIIGIHTPEFAFEKDTENVMESVRKFGIRYPVALDNDKQTWKAYSNHYWPHKYLIDAQGNTRYEQIGEGYYLEMEEQIRKLLKENGRTLDEGMTRVAAEDVRFREIKTPEIYFGRDHAGFLGNPMGFSLKPLDYQVPEDLTEGFFYLAGPWAVHSENVEYVGEGTGKILLRYTARVLNFVAGAPGRTVRVEVFLDGMPLNPANAGDDIQFDEMGKSLLMIEEPRLYSVIRDRAGYAPHQVEFKIYDQGLEAYTFTFG